MKTKNIKSDSIKTGIVVGAAPVRRERSKLIDFLKKCKQGVDCVIAADGGISFFLEENLRPDMWIGDMDSSEKGIEGKVEAAFEDIDIRTCSPIKDDTDIALAVRILVEEKNCQEVYIFGGMGGDRIDHSMANIQLMHHYKEKGRMLRVFSENSELFLLADETADFDENQTGTISVFSLTDESIVEIEGLFYEYKGIIKNTYALGVSNEFCGKKSKIKVIKGRVLVIKTIER